MARRSVAWLVVASVVALTAAAGWIASRVVPEDDLLAALPASDPGVRAFLEINRRFGGLHVALAGIESDDVFAGTFPARLARATERLNATRGVGFALSLTNLEVFVADPERGGIRSEYLPMERERVAREDVARELVAPDGRAVLLYVFGTPELDTTLVRAVIEEEFPSEKRHFHGAPFIAAHVRDTTAASLRLLGPWSAAAVLIVLVLALRNLGSVALVILPPAIGVLVAIATMALAGQRLDLLLAFVPLLVFALGSGFALASVDGNRVWWPALAAIAALLAFFLPGPSPRVGVYTAAGLAATLVLCVTFVPAALALLGPRDARLAEPPRRRGAPIVAAVLAMASLPLALRVDAGLARPFGPHSAPGQAEAFLDEHFGGAAYAQVQLAGDLTDPSVLRRVAELSDRIAVLPGVARTTSITTVLRLLGEALSGDRVLPDTVAKARLLHGFLEGKRAVRQLIDEARAHALVQVQLEPVDPAPVLAAIRAVVARPPGDARAAVLARVGTILDPEPLAPFAARLQASPRPPAAPEAVRVALERFLGSDEFLGELPDGVDAARVAELATAPTAGTELTAALGVELAEELERPLAEIRRREQARAWARVLAPGVPEEKVTAIGHALLELDRVALPQAPVAVTVSGEPAMVESLGITVRADTLRGLVAALFVIAVACRSLLAAGAAGLAVLLLGAGMKLLGVPLDPATGLLAGLALGAAAFHAGTPRVAVPHGLVVAAGLLVLAFSDTPSIARIAGLGAAAILLAVLSTLSLRSS